MTLSKTISNSDEVARYLRIAKRYSQSIRRAKEIRVPGMLCDHASIVSVFSAAAVETALNLYICMPILFTKDQRARSYFGSFITKYARLSIRKKINFVRQFCQELKNNPALYKEVNRLFDDRNSTLHSTPCYSESLGIDFSRLKKVRFDNLKQSPTLTLKSIGTDDILESVRHYETASKFIELLDRSNSARLKTHANVP